jgi:hypothetical protein
MENKKIVVGSSFTATTYRFLDKTPEVAVENEAALKKKDGDK